MEAELVKETELSKQRERMMSIYIYIKVKDVKECISISIKK